MYVARERRAERKVGHGPRLIFWLVESQRDAGRVRTRKVAYLGSIYELFVTPIDQLPRVTISTYRQPVARARDRNHLWKQANVAFDRVGVAPEDRQRLSAQLAEWVPIVTPEEQANVEKAQAEAWARLTAFRKS